MANEGQARALKAVPESEREGVLKRAAESGAVTVKEIIEQDKRLDVPTSLEVLKAAQRETKESQMDLAYNAA